MLLSTFRNTQYRNVFTFLPSTVVYNGMQKKKINLIFFRLLQECTQFLGTGVSDTIRRMKKDEFPLLVLAQGKGRTCDVTAIMQG